MQTPLSILFGLFVASCFTSSYALMTCNGTRGEYRDTCCSKAPATPFDWTQWHLICPSSNLKYQMARNLDFSGMTPYARFGMGAWTPLLQDTLFPANFLNCPGSMSASAAFAGMIPHPMIGATDVCSPFVVDMTRMFQRIFEFEIALGFDGSVSQQVMHVGFHNLFDANATTYDPSHDVASLQGLDSNTVHDWFVEFQTLAQTSSIPFGMAAYLMAIAWTHWGIVCAHVADATCHFVWALGDRTDDSGVSVLAQGATYGVGALGTGSMTMQSGLHKYDVAKKNVLLFAGDGPMSNAFGGDGFGAEFGSGLSPSSWRGE